MQRKYGSFLVYTGIAVSIALIIYCCIYIYNYYSANDILWHVPRSHDISGGKALAPNEVADTIGGVLSPIIGLVASILTFLAFYMQKRANDSIQFQFKIQQFESQFYEMLRLHKANVDEVSIKSFRTEKTESRRAAFETMVADLNSLLAYASFGTNPLTEQEYEAVYNIFFWGYSEEEVNRLAPFNQTLFRHEGIVGDNPIPNFRNHKGYSSFLGHYFRHLFLMVKFVVHSKTIPKYKAKMKYLKMLRAQLSNHEQIMLFYNWLCTDYGGAWEDDSNHFFTTYKMIHNLWTNELHRNQYIVDAVNLLIDEYNKQPKKTPLFEFQRKQFDLKMEGIQDIPVAHNLWKDWIDIP